MGKMLAQMTGNTVAPARIGFLATAIAKSTGCPITEL
jgi:hypothetical protein